MSPSVPGASRQFQAEFPCGLARIDPVPAAQEISAMILAQRRNHGCGKGGDWGILEMEAIKAQRLQGILQDATYGRDVLASVERLAGMTDIQVIGYQAFALNCPFHHIV